MAAPPATEWTHDIAHAGRVLLASSHLVDTPGGVVHVGRLWTRGSQPLVRYRVGVGGTIEWSYSGASLALNPQRVLAHGDGFVVLGDTRNADGLRVMAILAFDGDGQERWAWRDDYDLEHNEARIAGFERLANGELALAIEGGYPDDVVLYRLSEQGALLSRQPYDYWSGPSDYPQPVDVDFHDTDGTPSGCIRVGPTGARQLSAMTFSSGRVFAAHAPLGLITGGICAFDAQGRIYIAGADRQVADGTRVVRITRSGEVEWQSAQPGGSVTALVSTADGGVGVVRNTSSTASVLVRIEPLGNTGLAHPLPAYTFAVSAIGDDFVVAYTNTTPAFEIVPFDGSATTRHAVSTGEAVFWSNDVIRRDGKLWGAYLTTGFTAKPHVVSVDETTGAMMHTQGARAGIGVEGCPGSVVTLPQGGLATAAFSEDAQGSVDLVSTVDSVGASGAPVWRFDLPLLKFWRRMPNVDQECVMSAVDRSGNVYIAGAAPDSPYAAGTDGLRLKTRIHSSFVDGAQAHAFDIPGRPLALGAAADRLLFAGIDTDWSIYLRAATPDGEVLWDVALPACCGSFGSETPLQIAVADTHAWVTGWEEAGSGGQIYVRRTDLADGSGGLMMLGERCSSGVPRATLLPDGGLTIAAPICNPGTPRVLRVITLAADGAALSQRDTQGSIRPIALRALDGGGSAMLFQETTSSVALLDAAGNLAWRQDSCCLTRIAVSRDVILVAGSTSRPGNRSVPTFAAYGTDGVLREAWTLTSGGHDNGSLDWLGTDAQGRFAYLQQWVDASGTPALRVGTFAAMHAAIEVAGNANVLADGDASPSYADGTDFGPMARSAGTVVHTFAIRNTGGVALDLGAVSLTGEAAAEFRVVRQPAATVAAGQTTMLDVEFDPVVLGPREANIVFDTSDSRAPSFDFAIRGTGTAALLRMQSGTVEIPDGAQVDIGDAEVHGAPIQREFVVHNDGNVDLAVGQVAIGGMHANEVALVSSPALRIAPGAASALIVQFDPAARGARSASVVLRSNAETIPEFRFDLQAAGLGPILEVAGDGDFGVLPLHGASVAKEFVVRNAGEGVLQVTGMQVVGPHDEDFELASAMPGPMLPGAQAVLRVTFDPGAGGARRAVLRVTGNEAWIAPIELGLQGVGEVADLQVSISNDSDRVVTGRETIYAIRVINAGPGAASGVRIESDIDEALFGDAQWTCNSQPTIQCPAASGGPDIDVQTDRLEEGASLDFTLIALPMAASGQATTAVQLTGLDGVDSQPANDSATDTDPVFEQAIFGAGFEGEVASL